MAATFLSGLTQAFGVHAAALLDSSGGVTFSTSTIPEALPQGLEEILRHMLAVRAKALEAGMPDDVRAVVGSTAIVIEATQAGAVAVAFKLGHPIGKSLRRMVRRGARQLKAAT